MKYDVSSLITHSGEMIWIDEVKDFTQNSIVVKSTIKDTNPFLEDGCLPNFTYIEIIAQAVSALAGIKARENGKGLALNLLLGCRNFQMYKESLKVGANLIIHAKASLHEDDGFGIYDCTMYEDDFLVAEGSLNVYTPNEESTQKVMNE